jgi:hypothetical protein
MKVGDLVMLADRRTAALVIEKRRNRVYRVLIGDSSFWVIRSQIWKVMNESR